MVAWNASALTGIIIWQYTESKFDWFQVSVHHPSSLLAPDWFMLTGAMLTGALCSLCLQNAIAYLSGTYACPAALLFTCASSSQPLNAPAAQTTSNPAT